MELYHVSPVSLKRLKNLEMKTSLRHGTSDFELACQKVF
jgi:hypothetical protein